MNGSIITANKGAVNIVLVGTDEDMDRILSSCKKIFSNPLSEEQCQTLLLNIIYSYTLNNNDITKLEDVLADAADFFELLEDSLFEGSDDGQHELPNAPF